MSTWLQASIFHALIHVLEDVGVGEREAQTFTVAAMPFIHPTGKAGATSTIFAPISVQVKSGQDVEDTAKAVAESFALARRFTVDVQDDYVKTLLKLFSSIRYVVFLASSEPFLCTQKSDMLSTLTRVLSFLFETALQARDECPDILQSRPSRNSRGAQAIPCGSQEQPSVHRHSRLDAQRPAQLDVFLGACEI